MKLKQSCKCRTCGGRVFFSWFPSSDGCGVACSVGDNGGQCEQSGHRHDGPTEELIAHGKCQQCGTMHCESAKRQQHQKGSAT